MQTQSRMVRDFGILTFIFFLMASIPGLNPTVASRISEAGVLSLGIVATLLKVTTDDDIKGDLIDIKSTVEENNDKISLVKSNLIDNSVNTVPDVKQVAINADIVNVQEKK